MSGIGIRAKIKRRFSHKEPETNFDEHSDADEETSEYLNHEIEKAEKDGHEQGRPGSLLNRMISHGNKKTEDQIAQEVASGQKQGNVSSTGSTTTATTGGQSTTQTRT